MWTESELIRGISSCEWIVKAKRWCWWEAVQRRPGWNRVSIELGCGRASFNLCYSISQGAEIERQEVRRRDFVLIEPKLRTCGPVAAKDRRKPVIAILQDHFDVPSIVTCSACSRLSMWVSGSTLKVRLAATWNKRWLFSVRCVLACLTVRRFCRHCWLYVPLKGRERLVTSTRRLQTCDCNLGAPFRGAVEYWLLDCAHVRRVGFPFDAEDLSVTYTGISAFVGHYLFFL